MSEPKMSELMESYAKNGYDGWIVRPQCPCHDVRVDVYVDDASGIPSIPLFCPAGRGERLSNADADTLARRCRAIMTGDDETSGGWHMKTRLTVAEWLVVVLCVIIGGACVWQWQDCRSRGGVYVAAMFSCAARQP